MADFREFHLSVRVRVLRTESDEAPARSEARSAALQAVSNALLKAESEGFEHDRSEELSVVFKDADVEYEEDDPE